MRKTFFVLAIVMLLFACSVVAVGLGVSPSVVDFNEVLKGKLYEKVVRIQNTGSEPVIVSLDVKNYSEWFSFPESVVVPAKQEELPGYKDVILSLKVPKKASVGFYETRAYACGKVGTNINMCVGFNLEMDVTNEKVFCGIVNNIRTRDVIVGDPLRFLIGYSNCGNVLHNVVTQIDLVSQYGILKSFKTHFKIGAYSSMILESNFYKTNKLETGDYVANVKVFLKNRNELDLLEEKEVHFRVL